jgi:hypothetical protein
MLGKNLPFRAWYYFRIGWSTYFAFVLAAINTLVVTYYLAIEKAPFLKQIFPSFTSYIATLAAIGIPILVLIGYLHYKKSPAYSSEADISMEAYPYNYKLTPGYNKEVVFPMYLSLTNLILKISKNEKLTEKELEELTAIQKKLMILINGGNIGHPKSGIATGK